MATNVGFEGLTKPGVFKATIPAGYAGFNWTNCGTIGMKYADLNFHDDGYHHVIHQKICGIALDNGGGVVNSRIDDANVAAHETLSLESGIFAAAFNTGEHVTFQAFLGGVFVGQKVVVMDQTAQTIHFGKNFQHIDSVHILSDGGTDANPDDGGTGADIAMDNLKVMFDPIPTSVHTDPAMTAHEYGVMHHDGWALM